jgi:hypothetical protein
VSILCMPISAKNPERLAQHRLKTTDQFTWVFRAASLDFKMIKSVDNIITKLKFLQIRFCLEVTVKTDPLKSIEAIITNLNSTKLGFVCKLRSKLIHQIGSRSSSTSCRIRCRTSNGKRWLPLTFFFLGGGGICPFLLWLCLDR